MFETTLNDVYEAYNQLSLAEKEYFVQLVERQISDERRQAILEREKEAEFNYKNGNSVKGSVIEIMEFLENDWNRYWWGL